jgi:cytochrome c peroxidase
MESSMKNLLPIAVLFLAACGTATKESKKIEDPIAPWQAAVWAQARSAFDPITQIKEKDDNPVTKAKVELGKMLYHDTRLSKTGNNSCNSCHNLATFGVDNEVTSPGDAGKRGDRNSPTVLNAALANMQFWDGRARDVEEQAGMPILNPAEMAIPSKEFLVNRLKGTEEYPALFAKAFPREQNPLTYANIEKAIGAFERTLLTPTRFDDFLAKNPSYLSAEETEGLKVFLEAGCATCHGGVGVGGGQLQKFGVHYDYRAFTGSKHNDIGRMAVTGQSSDKDVFKVPTLRNVAKTAPYFHDGSVAELDKAIAIMAKTQLNKDLTDEEVKKIAVFLHALTGEVPQSALQVPKGVSMR